MLIIISLYELTKTSPLPLIGQNLLKAFPAVMHDSDSGIDSGMIPFFWKNQNWNWNRDWNWNQWRANPNPDLI